VSAADREAAVDAIVRCARTVRGLAEEILDAEARADAADMQRDDAAHKAGEWRESHDIERTRADAAEAECARLTTERDAARRAATLAETERDTLRALTDSMRADNVRLRGIVESVRSARAVSAAAAARYTAAWDAVGTLPPTAAQSEEIAAALRAAYEAGDALTAALDAAGEGR
jgi:hypothetical protein